MTSRAAFVLVNGPALARLQKTFDGIASKQRTRAAHDRAPASIVEQHRRTWAVTVEAAIRPTLQRSQQLQWAFQRVRELRRKHIAIVRRRSVRPVAPS